MFFPNLFARIYLRDLNEDLMLVLCSPCYLMFGGTRHQQYFAFSIYFMYYSRTVICLYTSNDVIFFTQLHFNINQPSTVYTISEFYWSKFTRWKFFSWWKFCLSEFARVRVIWVAILQVVLARIKSFHVGINKVGIDSRGSSLGGIQLKRLS